MAKIPIIAVLKQLFGGVDNDELAGHARPHDPATRLMASVAFLVKITSRSDGAPMNRATLALAASNALVALALQQVCFGLWLINRYPADVQQASWSTHASGSGFQEKK